MREGRKKPLVLLRMEIVFPGVLKIIFLLLIIFVLLIVFLLIIFVLLIVFEELLQYVHMKAGPLKTSE